MVERLVYTENVGGSKPSPPTLLLNSFVGVLHIGKNYFLHPARGGKGYGTNLWGGGYRFRSEAFAERISPMTKRGR